jgi:hypothetical protein
MAAVRQWQVRESGAVGFASLGDARLPPAPLRVKSKFSKQFNVICPVQSRSKKYSAFPKSQITLYQTHPAPGEGRWPSSRTLGRDAVDAAASGVRRDRGADLSSVSDLRHARRTALKRTAKACGPDASMPASSLAEVCCARPGARAIFRKATVTRKPDHRGERAISRKAIAWGCRMIPVNSL